MLLRIYLISLLAAFVAAGFVWLMWDVAGAVRARLAARAAAKAVQRDAEALAEDADALLDQARDRPDGEGR